MPRPNEYRSKLAALGLDELELRATNATEAKAAIKRSLHLIRELRQIKKAVNLDIKAIRNSFKSEIAEAGELTGGLFALFGKRGAAGSIRADAKRSLRRDRDRAIAPYDNLKLTIDDLVTQLESAKLQLNSYMEQGLDEGAEAKPRRSHSEGFCPDCGGEIATSDAFCRHCGCRLTPEGEQFR